MHTIEYTSSRSEVWRWYWRAWAKPSGFWLLHLCLGVLFAAGVALTAREPFSFTRSTLLALTAMAVCVALLPLWPQIRFKPSHRSLTIEPAGLRTTIGKLSGSRSWSEIGAIVETGDEIVISGKNGNAFIIPRRAFKDEGHRQEFLRDAQTWHRQS